MKLLPSFQKARSTRVVGASVLSRPQSSKRHRRHFTSTSLTLQAMRHSIERNGKVPSEKSVRASSWRERLHGTVSCGHTVGHNVICSSQSDKAAEFISTMALFMGTINPGPGCSLFILPPADKKEGNHGDYANNIAINKFKQRVRWRAMSNILRQKDEELERWRNERCQVKRINFCEARYSH
jgi:hypothetical protein